MKYYSTRKTKNYWLILHRDESQHHYAKQEKPDIRDQNIIHFHFTKFPEKANSQTQIAGYLGFEVGIRVVIHWKQVEEISQEDRYVLTLNYEVAQLSRFTINIQCLLLMVAFYIMYIVPQGSWVKNALPISYRIIFTLSKSETFIWGERMRIVVSWECDRDREWCKDSFLGVLEMFHPFPWMIIAEL